MLTFADISSHQPAGIVPAGDGVILKATEGETYFSGHMPSQLEAARKKEMLVGFYHFARYYQSAKKNADNFLRALDKHWKPGDNIVLDHEAQVPSYIPTAREASVWGLLWLDRVVSSTGQIPWVYSNISWATAGHCAGMADYPWWGAAPSIPKGQLTKRGPFKRIVAHQYSIAGGTDRDVFYGTRQDWIDLAKRGNSQKGEEVFGGPAPTIVGERYSQSVEKGSVNTWGVWFDSPNKLTYRIAAHSASGHGDIKDDLVVGGPASPKDSWPEKVYWSTHLKDVDAFSIELLKIEGPLGWGLSQPDQNGKFILPGWDASKQ